MPLPSEQAGDVLGSYSLEKCLGEGAMGRVWLGRHVKLGRLAAIKVLKAEHTQNSELIGRFFDEARAVNQVNHEHIVAISDFVEDRDQARVYCVMEYLTGESLERRLAREPLQLAETLAVMRQVCEALAAAHALGIVHRDVKPDNIFLSQKADGSLFAKVLDFGVAKLSPAMKRESVTTTQSGQLVGTPAYMAPEQLVGIEVDASADVYSVGTLLYRLLAGSLPFAESDVGKLSLLVIKEPAPPLPRKTPAGEPIPRLVAAAVKAALAKEASARPTLAAIIGALSGLARAPAPRWPWLAAVAAVLLAGAAVWVATRPAPVVARVVVPTPAPPAATITLTVRTEPPGALVTRADTGEALGTTPLKRPLPRGATPLELHLAHDGYLDAQRTVTPTGDVELELVLQPIASAPVRAAKKAKKMRLTDEGTIDPF